MALLPYIMLCQHAKWTNARPPAFTAADLKSLKWQVRTYSVMVVKSAADGMFQRVFTVLWVWLVPRVCTIWGNPTHACQWKQQQQQQQHFDSKKERKCWKTSLFWSQVVWRWSLRSSLTCRINKKRDTFVKMKAWELNSWLLLQSRQPEHGEKGREGKCLK